MFKITGELQTELLDGHPDFVVTAPWATVYERDGVVGELGGQTSFTYDASASFTPFDELTEDQVIQWVKDALGPEAVTFYENKVKEVVDAAVESEEPNPRKIFVTAVYTAKQNKPAPWAA